MLTEFAGGGSLDRMIKSSSPVPMDTVRIHTTQILDALSYLHNKAVSAQRPQGKNSSIHNYEGEKDRELE